MVWLEAIRALGDAGTSMRCYIELLGLGIEDDNRIMMTSKLP